MASQPARSIATPMSTTSSGGILLGTWIPKRITYHPPESGAERGRPYRARGRPIKRSPMNAAAVGDLVLSDGWTRIRCRPPRERVHDNREYRQEREHEREAVRVQNGITNGKK